MVLRPFLGVIDGRLVSKDFGSSAMRAILALSRIDPGHSSFLGSGIGLR
jgi:hypothetical protein